MKIKVETKKQIVLKCKSVFLFGLILSHQLCDQKMTILWTRDKKEKQLLTLFFFMSIYLIIPELLVDYLAMT